MNRACMTFGTLAVLAFLGTSRAQAQMVIAHETDLAFDGTNGQYDAYDTFRSPAAVSFTASVPIAGDPTTFTGDGSGALVVSNVATSGKTGSANLALTGVGSALNPLIGYGHYGYGSSSGQGLFTVANVSGNTVLSLTALPADLSGSNASYNLNVAFLGNWSTNGAGPLQIDAPSFALPPRYTVTTNFVYDPTFDTTYFRATSPANTPEPGIAALVVGMMAPLAGFAARRKRRA